MKLNKTVSKDRLYIAIMDILLEEYKEYNDGELEYLPIITAIYNLHKAFDGGGFFISEELSSIILLSLEDYNYIKGSKHVSYTNLSKLLNDVIKQAM